MKGFPLRAWAGIDLAALERNLHAIQAALPSNVAYVAVVKADAYGHGLPQTVTRLMQSGVDLFAVANLREAAAIREIGSGWPILILSAILPSEDEYLWEYDVIPTLSSHDELQRWTTLAKAKQQRLAVHVKIDTGMGRLGVWHEQAFELLQKISEVKEFIHLAGIYTHFSSADSDPEFTQLQRTRFLNVLQQYQPDPALLIHADNSAGIDTFSVDGPYNAVRIGLMQFGISPYPESMLGRVATEPVLSFHCHLSLVKNLPAGSHISYGRTFTCSSPKHIGILSAGYADGIPTALSNRGSVLIHGKRCPILGRVTMDQTIVDLSNCPEAQTGDHVTLIGVEGEEMISATEFASKSQLIPWEVLVSISKRVPRIYHTVRGL